jgi:hypothetical protein
MQARLAQQRAAEATKMSHSAEEARHQAEETRRKEQALAVRLQNAYEKHSNSQTVVLHACTPACRSGSYAAMCVACLRTFGPCSLQGLRCGALWHERAVWCAMCLTPVPCLQAKKEGFNLHAIEEDLDAATEKYNRAREHVRPPPDALHQLPTCRCLQTANALLTLTEAVGQCTRT